MPAARSFSQSWSPSRLIEPMVAGHFDSLAVQVFLLYANSGDKHGLWPAFRVAHTVHHNRTEVPTCLELNDARVLWRKLVFVLTQPRNTFLHAIRLVYMRFTGSSPILANTGKVMLFKLRNGEACNTLITSKCGLVLTQNYLGLSGRYQEALSWKSCQSRLLHRRAQLR